jgi:hypothetical protein
VKLAIALIVALLPALASASDTIIFQAPSLRSLFAGPGVGPAGSTNEACIEASGFGFKVLSVNGNVTVGVTYPQCSFNSGFGAWALAANTTGYKNACFGARCADNNTTGYHLTGVGYGVLHWNVTGIQHTAGGFEALHDITGGQNSTAFGAFSLRHSLGSWNTCEGAQSGMMLYTGNRNVCLGFNALLYGGMASDTVAVGYAAGQGATDVQRGIFLGSRADAAPGLTDVIVLRTDFVAPHSNGVWIAGPNQPTEFGSTIDTTTVIDRASGTPVASESCIAGTFEWDDDFVYVCTSGGWKRAALSGY